MYVYVEFFKMSILRRVLEGEYFIESFVLVFYGEFFLEELLLESFVCVCMRMCMYVYVYVIYICICRAF